MKQFKNHHAHGISKPMKFLQGVLFGLSSIGSGVCFASILIAFIEPDSTFQTAPVLWSVCIIAAFFVATAIDFAIIQRFGKFAFADLIAWFTGQFDMSALRKLAAVLLAIFVAGGIFASFVTSYDGAKIAASMAPTFTSSTTLLHAVKDERSQVKKAIAPLEKEVSTIEKKMQSEVDGRSAGLLVLAKNGNAWAKKEIARIEAEVSKKYSRELSVAKSNLSKAMQREQTNSDAVIAAATAEVTSIQRANETKQTGIRVVLSAMGVLPLLAGVLLLIIECIGSVSLQLPTPTLSSKQSNTSGPGQRTDNGLESLFSNP